VPIVGFSATFARNDEKQLLWVFEEVVLHITTDELVKDGL
jgi:superfamily II DNA or RNA helicase